MPTPLAIAGKVALQAGIQAGSSLIGKLAQATASGANISSLTDLGKATRVEPLVLVDKALVDNPFITDIMKTSLSIFTGYYMQGVSMVMQVGRIDTIRVLDALNPNRSLGTPNGMRDVVFSREAYDQGLPSMESFNQPIERGLIVSVEDGEADPKSSRGIDSESIKKLYEVENLAVGKMISVELKDGNQTAKIPVMIRLVPTTVPGSVLAHIFTATARNSSWKERYHLWRAGQISFVRDLMFSIDIIDEHRKALINDTSNVYMTIHDRKRNNAIKSSTSGAPSMADASNIAIITKQTAKEIGRAMTGKIESLAVRKKIFDSTYLMLLFVVDAEWERVTIYHRGIDQPTEASFRDIKSSEKGKGPDITEILKAYQIGSQPSL